VDGRGRRGWALVVAFALLLCVPAFGAFPGDPAEGPRVNAPNDPDFDKCEPDDQQTPGEQECDSYFSEQFEAFGFRPESARGVDNQPLKYPNCDQLDGQGRAANKSKGDPECAQIAGVRADSAWKYSTGDAGTVVAIFDNGNRWDNEELIEKVALNTGELPFPQGATKHDKNGDGEVSVSDYAADGRVDKAAGADTGKADKLLDASDLIATFGKDGVDNDNNGYVDDIAGWDFFEDDNDPTDSSDCCQSGHGTDRAEEAVRETDNAKGKAGLCPECQYMPLRTSDSIVHDTNLIGLATVYSADNGVDVTECACGGLTNSDFSRRAFEYADRKGLAQMMVSSDINSANHNYPTNYNEAIYVGGSLPDTAPSESCEIPGLPLVGGGAEPPGCKAFLAALKKAGVDARLPGQLVTTSFFRNANLTQYGGKADIVLMGATGSANTGQSSGAAALLASYGRKTFGAGAPLSGNEIRQLLTMTAEDVLPENTGSIGQADRAEDGWDSHFGYGRVNLAGAMKRIEEKRIPPEVQIDSPDWFAPVNIDRVGAAGLPVTGRVVSRHFDGVSWKLEYACGQHALDDEDFKEIASGSGDVNGALGTIPKNTLMDLAENCDGSVKDDAGRPAGNPTQAKGAWPANPYPEPDPERHAFQIRLVASQAGDESNVGVYRKTLHAYRDDGNLTGFPRPLGPGAEAGKLTVGAGGETSPRMGDLDADNKLDLVLPNSSGEVEVLRGNGTPLPSWNGGKPVRTGLYEQGKRHGTGGMGGEPPHEVPRAPAIGDISGDGEPEVVLTAGERIYAWHRDGKEVSGFPQRIDPHRARPCKDPGTPVCFDEEDRFLTEDRPFKRGFLGSPALADLDEDGRLDIVAGALDQHVYAWNGKGASLPGFPARVDSEDESDGSEIATSPAIADLDGDEDPEIVVSTNEVIGADNDSFDPRDILNIFLGNATGTNPTYALHGDGKAVAGWPVRTGVAAGDILPLVIPGHDAAVGDLDRGRKGDEVVVSAGTGLGARLIAGDGGVIQPFASTPPSGAGLTDPSAQINLADYPSIGRLSDSAGPSVIKGGLSALGAANLLAVNQNLPFNHSVQAWNPSNGTYRPRFPVATDDFQLLSQPTIAKVGGGGGGRQALVGTGLYQVHAYGEDSTEPAGWPKFAGGWLFATPTVGDLDGDGKLDVATATREGFGFAWKTDVPACTAGGTSTNNEWWTFHHDEHSTANYGHDARPPSRPGALSVDRKPNGDLELSFAASGDDLLCGDATRYEVAGASSAIDSGSEFIGGSKLAASEGGGGARTRAAGDATTLTVKDGARFATVAVRAVDDFGNRSYLRAASVPSRSAARTPADTGSPNRDGAGTDDGNPATPATRGAGDGGSLPFTGLQIALILLTALALATAGLALRRHSRATGEDQPPV
jgi:hypothetical protein